MTAFLAGALAGFVAGLVLGIRSGKSIARALRSWRDWRGTKRTISGLRRRTVAQWLKALRHLAVFVVVAVALAGLLYEAATR